MFECISIKRQIEALIQRGELRDFVNQIIDDYQNVPRQPIVQNNNLPTLLAPQQGNLWEIRTIFGGPKTEDIVWERKCYAS